MSLEEEKVFLKVRCYSDTDLSDITSDITLVIISLPMEEEGSPTTYDYLVAACLWLRPTLEENKSLDSEKAI